MMLIFFFSMSVSSSLIFISVIFPLPLPETSTDLHRTLFTLSQFFNLNSATVAI